MRTVAPTCLVKAPVLGDAQGRVVVALLLHIHPSGGGGADLQHEVGRLSLLRNDIAVAPVVGIRIHIERDQHVGIPNPRHVAGRDRGKIQVAPQQGGGGTAKVLGQMERAAADGQVLKIGHQFVGIAQGGIRER